MTRRREHPLPNLPISIDTLPPPEKRTSRLTLSFTEAELAMIERTAQERGEQPAVFCRIIILTAFENAAAQVMAAHPGLLGQSRAEQQRRLLDVFRA
jgi:hypothetical protein